MKRIKSSGEPSELAEYRERFKAQPSPRKWEEFRKTGDSKKVASQLMVNQKGLCAYCEIDLTTRDCSVEHFIPKHLSTKEDNLNLKWQNLMLVCKGGRQKDAVSDDGADEAYRLALPPHVEHSCGSKKRRYVPDGRLLNPFEIPAFPLLFSVRSLSGILRPDEAACKEAGLDEGDVDHTIEVLGLNCHRLKINRAAVIEEIDRELLEAETDGRDLAEFERKLAADYFGDGSGDWPPFFTTCRDYFGEVAEEHLEKIGYEG